VVEGVREQARAEVQKTPNLSFLILNHNILSGCFYCFSSKNLFIKMISCVCRMSKGFIDGGGRSFLGGLNGSKKMPVS